MTLIHKLGVALAATATLGGLLAATPASAAPAPAPVKAAAALPSLTTATPGSGWSAISINSYNPDDTATGIFLVDPAGRQRRVANFKANWSVVDFSNDGARILLRHWNNDVFTWRVLNVATGSSSGVSGLFENARFTNPDGKSLLAYRRATGVTYRRSLSGTILTVFPYANEELAMLPTMGGRYLMSARNGKVTMSGNVTGRLLRRFAIPSGFASCVPVRWWNSTTFVERCADAGGRFAIFLQNIAGGTPSRQTYSSGDAPYGFDNLYPSWDLPIATAVSPCGWSRLGMIAFKKVFSPFAVDSDAFSPITVIGNKAFYHFGMPCGDSPMQRSPSSTSSGSGCGSWPAVRSTAATPPASRCSTTAAEQLTNRWWASGPPPVLSVVACPGAATDH